MFQSGLTSRFSRTLGVWPCSTRCVSVLQLANKVSTRKSPAIPRVSSTSKCQCLGLANSIERNESLSLREAETLFFGLRHFFFCFDKDCFSTTVHVTLDWKTQSQVHLSNFSVFSHCQTFKVFKPLKKLLVKLEQVSGPAQRSPGRPCPNLAGCT